MKKTGRYPYTKIVYSCITGRAVWIYRGMSKAASKVAYRRVCIREIERVKSFAARAARRKANIRRLIECLMEAMTAGKPLTPQQQQALRQMQAIERTEYACDRSLYDHIMEERRRRKKAREMRRKMREREKE